MLPSTSCNRSPVGFADAGMFLLVVLIEVRLNADHEILVVYAERARPCVVGTAEAYLAVAFAYRCHDGGYHHVARARHTQSGIEYGM